MTRTTRRTLLQLSMGMVGAGIPASITAARPAEWTPFIAEAFRMKRVATDSGDQPYGAVMVFDGRIVGHGPSRVVLDRSEDAHAERVALWDAQKRLGRDDLAGATIVSTSRPCVCQAALARAKVGLMIYGENGTDGGRPQPGR